ncbi:MAG: GC-type dockerin domain-anchored protein [Phycisphaerales bacterium]
MYAFAPLSNGDLMVGGQFSTRTTPHAQNIARYAPAADTWSTLPCAGPVTDGSLESVTQLPSGDVLVSGSFTQIAGVAAPAFARYEPIARAWSSLPAPPAPNPGMGTGPTVGTTMALADGSVIALVNSTLSPGVSRTSVARFDPATGVWTPLGDAQGTLRPMALAPNGDVVVGGTFTAIGGVPASNIVRLNLATGIWSPLDAGVSGPVYSLAITPNGDVYVGGQFASASSVASRCFARFSAATNAWVPTGTEGLAPLPITLALLVLPDGDLLLGGYFTSIGGVSASHLARYHPATGAFSALGSGTNSDYLSSLRLAANGKVLVGGLFSTAGGVAVRSLAWYDPVSGAWSAFASQLDSNVSQNSIVYRAVPLASGDVLAIGRFGAAGGNVSAYFAHYTLGRTAPTIDSQPAARSVCVGGTVAFTVGASGGALAYQWLKGETTIDPAVNPSAATPTLTVAGASVTDAGFYRVMVTRTDGCGSATSSPAQLFVDPSDIGGAGGLPGRDGRHDNNDFIAFIGAFFDARPEADIGRVGGLLGPDGLYDNNDFIVFINEFFTALGC